MKKVMENDIYIAQKRISTENFLLKLNRQAHQLEVYKKQMGRLCGRTTASERILSRVNIRFMKNQGNAMPVRPRRFPNSLWCVWYCKKSKVKEEYISGYHKKYERIKFLAIWWFSKTTLFTVIFIWTEWHLKHLSRQSQSATEIPARQAAFGSARKM